MKLKREGQPAIRRADSRRLKRSKSSVECKNVTNYAVVHQKNIICVLNSKSNEQTQLNRTKSLSCPNLQNDLPGSRLKSQSDCYSPSILYRRTVTI